MRVLGIETSCDETGLALISGKNPESVSLLGEALFSQTHLHQFYGGVVPELAARDHVIRLVPLLKKTLGVHALSHIDAVAYTAGPGLIGPLMTGAVFAQALAFSLNCSAIGIHHLEAHLLSPQLSKPSPQLPFVALLISGGHTLLVLVRSLGRYEVLGETQDDAVGEAFDKTARLLGLKYPGGPEIENLAVSGTPGRFTLPRPMVQKPGLHFSFSGLKTHTANLFSKTQPCDYQTKADFALAFETAVAETLTIKCRRALKHAGVKTLVVAGGVSANQRIQKHLKSLEKEGFATFFPPLNLCTDNGIMVSYAGLVRLLANCQPNTYPEVFPRWSLTDLPPITPLLT